MITLGIYAAKTKLSEICERVASGSSWSSLSHRWVLEAASRLACREKLLRRQSRTVRRTRPSHHRRDTHRRAVPGNCRQSIARRSTIQRFSRIACPRSLLGLPNGSSYRLLLIRFCVSTLCTGESNRPRYVWMYKVPMAATPSPVDESSGSKLSDQFPDFSRYGVTILFFWRLSPRGDRLKERSQSKQPRALADVADSYGAKRPEPAEPGGTPHHLSRRIFGL